MRGETFFREEKSVRSGLSQWAKKDGRDYIILNTSSFMTPMTLQRCSWIISAPLAVRLAAIGLKTGDMA
jgi:hypothetical protein